MRCERWPASARTLQPRRAATGGQARVPGRGLIDVSMVTICPVLGSKIVMALPLRFVGGNAGDRTGSERSRAARTRLCSPARDAERRRAGPDLFGPVTRWRASL